jgi:hypothetical protein
VDVLVTFPLRIGDVNEMHRPLIPYYDLSPYRAANTGKSSKLLIDLQLSASRRQALAPERLSRRP